MLHCDICHTPTSSGDLVQGEGLCCSLDCKQIALNRQKARHDHLHAEPLGDMPEKLETADLEHWAMKFAVHFVRGLDAAGRAELTSKAPHLLQPEILALEFKERLLAKLNPAYHSSVEHHGHARFFSSGTYCLRQPVPREVILRTAEQAGLIQPRS